MYIEKLSLINFKNYTEADFEFSPQVNCFIGNNGEGKTNLLDAIHYLSFCKSFLNPLDNHNIRHDAPFFVIQGTFHLGENKEEIYCGLKRGQKKQFKRNKKEYDRLADHIGLLPLVVISPADSELITEGSESRRKFTDSVIAQYDHEYLYSLIKYNKALSQRNALLKRFSETGSFEKDSLEVWDMQLTDFGKKIHVEREKFLKGFIPKVQYYYEFISGGKEAVDIQYESHLNEEEFQAALLKAIKRDMAMHYTTVGIHKDDLVFLINGLPVKKFGSQGQQKSFLIALRLAQFDFIKEIKQVVPVICLDDIYDKLDESRMTKLMGLVASDNFGQVFITDTHEDRIQRLFRTTKVEFKQFRVKNS